MTLCWFCNEAIFDEVDEHHPDREHDEDYTVPCHPDCHHKHHLEAGDFHRWGAMSSTAGRKGYELALEACPDWHERGHDAAAGGKIAEIGGIARAARAARDSRGRFVAGAVK